VPVPSRDELIDYYAPILGQLQELHWQPSGNGSARCPGHDDYHNSLSVKIGRRGELLLNCFGDAGCTFPAIAQALGRAQKDFFWHDGETVSRPQERHTHTFDYVDEHGEVRYQSLRFEPKRFIQRRPDPERPGQYVNNLTGVERIPYRLPEILESDSDRVVFVVEGELKVHALEDMGFLATCNAGGSEQWPLHFGEKWFKRRRLVILPDQDEKGWRHANHVAKATYRSAASVRLVELPGLHLRDDVIDWRRRHAALNANQAAELLIRTVKEAPLYDPDGDWQMKHQVLRMEIARALAMSGVV
jgi:putative DNA primase/helicase